MNRRTFCAIDLFSGCGGLSCGLEDAGFHVIAAIESNAEAAATYSLNHPTTKVIIEDICKLDARAVKKAVGMTPVSIDLLAGCPPCQGFSSLRTKNGKNLVEDERNELLFEFLRFVIELRPQAVLLENVPALARDQRFSTFLRGMKEAGYVGEHRIIDVMDYAVPQSRRRLMYLAGLGFSIPFPAKGRVQKTVRDAIEHLLGPGQSGDPLHDWPEYHSAKVTKLIESIPKDGGSRSSLPAELQLACHARTDGFRDVYGRMCWDGPAPTITGGCINPSKGRFIHPYRNGSITLREAALLQGFPRKYRFEGTNKDRIALMIGNAFPPPAAKAAGTAIRRELNGRENVVS